jgi:hypothetical protein
MHEKLIAVLIGLALLIEGGAAGTDGLTTNAQPAKAQKQATGAEEKQDSLQAETAQTAKCPPYPDVWDWQAPKGERPVAGFKVKSMDNGDVMISYHQGELSGRFRTVSFFGRTEVQDYNAVFKGDYSTDAKSRIPFKENTILLRTGGGWRSGGCYDGLDYHVTIHDESGQKLLISRTLLYVFDKPVRYVTHPHCMNGPSFNYQVEAVAARFLRLKDGTFLLVAHVKDNGYVIRFDEDFQTKSRLINDKFFWMDTNVLNKFDAKYGDRSVEDKKLKQLYADLYRMLMNTKNGRGR